MRYIIFGFLVSSFIWITLIFGQMGNPTKMSQWVWDVYSKKIEISNKIDSSKVVIVAGSNALFGIDSKLLQDYFKKRVLNLGVNAGVGLPVTLYMAKKVLKKEDLVLMPLEYPMYSYDGECGEQMIDFVLSRVPELFWNLSLKEKFYIIWHVRLKRVWDGYFDKSDTPMMVGVYGINNIDNNGDQIKTEKRYRSKEMYDDLGKLKPEKYGENFKKNALGWRYLDSFVKWCKKRDIAVVFMPSTLMRDKSYLKNPKERWFYENIANIVRERGWRYKGEPFSYMYDKELYFNTNFHLINSGRVKRTLQMIEDLDK